MGLPLLYGYPPRRGESERSPAGRLPTLRSSSCRQEDSFRYRQVHVFCPQAVRCWMFGLRSCATPLGTSRRGTLYMCTCNCPLFFFRTHLFVLAPLPETLRGGGHSSVLGVTSPEVWARPVQCVARGKPFKLFWPWAYLRKIPGFPHSSGYWVYACPMPVYARKIWMQTGLFC